MRTRTHLRDCEQCGGSVAPLNRSSKARFCSRRCSGLAHRIPNPMPLQLSTPAATNARGRIYRAIRAGKLARPEIGECGHPGRVEAAHYTYAEPLRVRWLCVSCHRRWDRAEPKGGAYRPAEISRA